MLLADFSLHAGFLVRFSHGRLVRSGSLDRPSLRYRPAALFPGRDEQYLEVILAGPKRQGCKLFELRRLILQKPENTRRWLWFLDAPEPLGGQWGEIT